MRFTDTWIVNPEYPEYPVNPDHPDLIFRIEL